MQLKKGLTLAILLMIALIVRTAPAQISPEEVDRAIRRGTDHLIKQQRVDGSWAPQPGFVGGMTALCTLALINSGVPLESPPIQNGLSNLRSIGDPNMVYTVALQTMVFCAATPDQRDAAEARIARGAQTRARRSAISAGRRGHRTHRFARRDAPALTHANVQAGPAGIMDGPRRAATAAPVTNASSTPRFGFRPAGMTGSRAVPLRALSSNSRSDPKLGWQAEGPMRGV
jgi:hypothetical protein